MTGVDWKAVALIVGTQIGAGVLSLPFAIKGLGFFWGSLAILLASLLTYLTSLFLLEALYSTNPRFHMYDLVEHHFGRFGATVFLLLMIGAAYGALTAYLDGISEALYHLSNAPRAWTGLLVWALLSLITYRGLRLSSSVEAAAVFLMGLLFFTTILWAVGKGISPYHIPLSQAGLGTFATAFTVSVFAFFVHLVIPEVIKITKSKQRALQSISTGFFLTTIIYISFSLSVIGVLGPKTPEISVFGLVDTFGPFFSPIAYLIPLFTLLTSFLGVALGMVDMVTEYLRRRSLALSIVTVPPFVLFLLEYTFFSSILIGSLALLLTSGIIPSLLMLKLKRERLVPHRVWVAGLSLLVFLFVLLWELKDLLLT